jgi:hypothetical protein
MTTTPANLYKQNGYTDRKDYLRNLADDTGVPLQTVLMMADMLGPSEDFDGLVTELEDLADGQDYLGECGYSVDMEG